MEKKRNSLFPSLTGNNSRGNDNRRSGSGSSNGSLSRSNDFPSLSGTELGTSSSSGFSSDEFPSLSGDRSTPSYDAGRSNTAQSNGTGQKRNSIFSSMSRNNSNSRSNDNLQTIYPSTNPNAFPSLSRSDSGASSFSGFSSDEFPSLSDSSTTSYDTGRSNTAQSNGTGQKRNSIFSSRSRNNSNSRSNDNSQTIYPSTNVNAFPSLSGNGSGQSSFSSTTNNDVGRFNNAQSNGMEKKRNSLFPSLTGNNSRGNDNRRSGSGSSNGSLSRSNDFPSLSGTELGTSSSSGFSSDEFPSLSGDRNDSRRSSFTGSDGDRSFTTPLSSSSSRNDSGRMKTSNFPSSTSNNFPSLSGNNSGRSSFPTTPVAGTRNSFNAQARSNNNDNVLDKAKSLFSSRDTTRGRQNMSPNTRKTRELLDRMSPVKVQGGSLKTVSFNSEVERLQVFLETEGRPLNANIDLCQGPDNTPQKMSIYIEEGCERPLNVVIETPGSSNMISIRNMGEMELPMNAYVDDNVVGGDPARTLAETGDFETIQGGSVRSKPFGPEVSSVRILLSSDGRPLSARIELLQGPNNSKQVMDIYTEDGMERPFFAVIETPGRGNMVRVVNTAPLEFPMYCIVEPYDIKSRNDPSYSENESTQLTWS